MGLMGRMGLIAMDSETVEEIKKELDKRGCPPSIRIDLRSSGCCDASLNLISQTSEESDLSEEFDGLKVYMSQEIRDMTQGVTVTFKVFDGYYLKPKQPLSEWDGFSPTQIRVLSPSMA